MTKKTLLSKVEELKALEVQKKELEKAMETIKEEIQKEMDKKNTQELTAGDYIIKWTRYASSRFDTKRFKEDHKRLHEKYIKEMESRRFTIA